MVTKFLTENWREAGTLCVTNRNIALVLLEDLALLCLVLAWWEVLGNCPLSAVAPPPKTKQKDVINFHIDLISGICCDISKEAWP